MKKNITSGFKYFFIFFLIFQLTEIHPQQKANHRFSEPKKFVKQKNESFYNNFSAKKAGDNSSLRLDDVDNSDEEFSYNYFRIDKSEKSLWNGKHWRAEDFPLKVFINKSGSKYYKSKFKKFVNYALELWSIADSRIKYKISPSPEDADLIISFEQNLMDKYDENYLGITDYEISRNKRINKSMIEIGMLKYNNQVISDGEIKATIIHEIGHALGLGHSENEADIMYPFINPDSVEDLNYNELSEGDIEAIRSVINLGYKLKYSRNN
jgi:predicted Zn-dependent protease